MPRGDNHPPILERFEAAYMPEPNSGCWLWLRGGNENGYGLIWHHGKFAKAHRVSWVLFRGEISSGLCVLHRCDTPACVNPDHLFIGTVGDNNRDRVAKRRFTGPNHWQTVLTPDVVAAVRADDRCQPAIAAAYGLTRSTVRNIKLRLTWKDF